MDCTHLTSAGPHPGIGKPLRDYCARHPSPPAYSAHHERELAQHRHALARLQSRPRTAEGDQEIVREQARIDTLTRARADHLGNLRAADELHRARFGARPGPNPLPPARSLHPSPTTHLSSPGPAPVRASMPHGG